MDKKRHRVLIYFLLVLSIISIAVSFWIFFHRPLEVRELDVMFIVANDAVGFDLNNTALTFGKIPQGGSGTRKVIIDNMRSYAVEVRIFVSEDIASFVAVPENLYLPAFENATFSVMVSVPDDIREGNYTGRIRLETYRA